MVRCNALQCTGRGASLHVGAWWACSCACPLCSCERFRVCMLWACCVSSVHTGAHIWRRTGREVQSQGTGCTYKEVAPFRTSKHSALTLLTCSIMHDYPSDDPGRHSHPRIPGISPLRVPTARQRPRPGDAAPTPPRDRPNTSNALGPATRNTIRYTSLLCTLKGSGNGWLWCAGMVIRRRGSAPRS